MICYVKMNYMMMAKWLWKTLWYFKICYCHILKVPTTTSEWKLGIRSRPKSTRNMINLDLEIIMNHPNCFSKDQRMKKDVPRAFFCSRESSSLAYRLPSCVCVQFAFCPTIESWETYVTSHGCTSYLRTSLKVTTNSRWVYFCCHCHASKHQLTTWKKQC